MENYIRGLGIKQIKTSNTGKATPALDIQNWKEYSIRNLFQVLNVKKYSSIPETDGPYEFISSTSVNNGVSGKVDGIPVPGNCITVSTNGDCFDCFYHPEPIVISTDVEVLYSEHLTPAAAMFICTVLRLEKEKWSYGRKPKNGKVGNTLIRLPAAADGTPDFCFMERYIRFLPYGDKI